MTRQLLNGDEAVALAALHAGVSLGTGYPGTPSTEILEAFDAPDSNQSCPIRERSTTAPQALALLNANIAPWRVIAVLQKTA